ncbi:DUF6231 family protein [Thiobacillus denitrificans]|uniref:Uncharacterized protein n=1 Tax=Thiobacillus denitrificans TaxID=36861 RepID=A0A119CXY6_THIDE|nr:DUF6231 family protein [Thiobacillus denitrificans]KVW98939.1 hypothetical protein ABW22_02735 [Thiobacillus denitrificans]
MNWRDHLQARLLDIRPASVCALDAAAHQLAGGVLRNTPMHLHGNQPGQAAELALGIDALNGLDAQQAQHLISQTRLYTAPRILLAVRSDCALNEDMFIALGFTLSATDTSANVRVHYYDLDTYKTVPDWLNARHWANPERWEP